MEKINLFNKDKKPLLLIDNIFFSYSKEDKTLFSNFFLRIEENDFISIVGPNGSGKTTILKLLIKEFLPDNGFIYLKSKDLKHWKRKDLAKEMSYLPQKIPSEINFNVLDYVVMGRYPHKELLEDYNAEDYNIALNYLKKLDIINIKNKNFSFLSGGEQRIVMLAQALTTESSMLLLDEPDSFLDIAHKKEFYDILKYLNKEENKTIIAISHDLQIAFSYSKKICGIKNGKIIFVEETRNISESMISKLFETKINIYKDKDKMAIVY